MKNILVLLMAGVLLACGTQRVLADNHVPEKAVLITGASSGIGRLTAERLAGAGYFVYAGARKQSDMDALNAIDNIKALRLDVTVQKDIDDAVAIVSRDERGLWGLINNAGVNLEEPLIEADETTLQFVMDVNVYGVFRVTKAFAPLIIASKGRIINISSIGGILSGGWVGFGPYTMSKHAIEGFTDQLAWEMAKFDVAVIGIEPGSFSTRIGESRCKLMLAQKEQRRYKYFAEEMEAHHSNCEQRLEEDTPSNAPPPVLVVDAIELALSSDKPKEHYLVVSDAFEAQLTIGKLIEELVQLNGDHAFSIDREEIIEILDAEEAVRKGERSRGMPGDH